MLQEKFLRKHLFLNERYRYNFVMILRLNKFFLLILIFLFSLYNFSNIIYILITLDIDSELIIAIFVSFYWLSHFEVYTTFLKKKKN